MKSSDNAFIDGFRQGIRPDEIMDVPEWAEKNRVLPSKSSSEAGPWRNSRTPYLIEPMRAMSPHHPCEFVIMMFGAQLGKTESMINATGQYIDNAPGPIMWTQPSEGQAKKFSRQRIDPLFSETASIKDKISESKSRDSANTILVKDFVGGILLLVGANSSANLASTPVRYLLMDEIDRYPIDVDDEGSPVDLAIARTRTFSSRRKIGMTSTPTIKGASEIESYFNESDQQKYFVPCPHCKEKQTLEFKQLQWEKERPETVQYYCIHCGEGIQEWQKTWMLDPVNGAEWRSTKKAKDPAKVGFHLSSLYSPVGWLSWESIARQWEKAQGSDTKLKSFVNTVLAESWALKGEAPDWQRLYEQRESYNLGIIPITVSALTMGVDVQGDRLEAHVVGWGRNSEKWTVDYQVIPGDTSDLSNKGPWQRLSEMIQKDFPHASGQKLRIMATAIDSGYNTQKVYEFTRKHASLKVFAVKGQERMPLVVGAPKDVDIKTADGRVFYKGTKYWPVGINVIKPDIYGWLKRECPNEEDRAEVGYPTGYFHFPEMSEDWFKQLTAEQLVPIVINGYKRNRWQKIYERNEVLDTTVYAVAAAHLFGIPEWKEKEWLKYEALVGAIPQDLKEDQSIQVKLPEKKKKVRQHREDDDDFDIDIDLDI